VPDHGRHSSWYTAQVDATFTAPVDGQKGTTVYVPNSVSYASGQTIALLVDPQDPGYAELPGDRYIDAFRWIICAVFAVVMLGWDGLLIRSVIHAIRKQDVWRALPA
jgi:hypothetical protein